MVQIESIEAAAARIGSSIYESPLVHSKTLSRLTGNAMFLKLENLQMTGSFKERGALNRIFDTDRGRTAAGSHRSISRKSWPRSGLPRDSAWYSSSNLDASLDASHQSVRDSCVRRGRCPAWRLL